MKTDKERCRAYIMQLNNAVLSIRTPLDIKDDGLLQYIQMFDKHLINTLMDAQNVVENHKEKIES